MEHNEQAMQKYREMERLRGGRREDVVKKIEKFIQNTILNADMSVGTVYETLTKEFNRRQYTIEESTLINNYAECSFNFENAKLLTLSAGCNITETGKHEVFMYLESGLIEEEKLNLKFLSDFRLASYEEKNKLLVEMLDEKLYFLNVFTKDYEPHKIMTINNHLDCYVRAEPNYQYTENYFTIQKNDETQEIILETTNQNEFIEFLNKNMNVELLIEEFFQRVNKIDIRKELETAKKDLYTKKIDGTRLLKILKYTGSQDEELTLYGIMDDLEKTKLNFYVPLLEENVFYEEDSLFKEELIINTQRTIDHYEHEPIEIKEAFQEYLNCPVTKFGFSRNTELAVKTYNFYCNSYTSLFKGMSTRAEIRQGSRNKTFHTLNYNVLLNSGSLPSMLGTKMYIEQSFKPATNKLIEKIDQMCIPYITEKIPEAYKNYLAHKLRYVQGSMKPFEIAEFYNSMGELHEKICPLLTKVAYFREEQNELKARENMLTNEKIELEGSITSNIFKLGKNKEIYAKLAQLETEFEKLNQDRSDLMMKEAKATVAMTDYPTNKEMDIQTLFYPNSSPKQTKDIDFSKITKQEFVDIGERYKELIINNFIKLPEAIFTNIDVRSNKTNYILKNGDVFYSNEETKEEGIISNEYIKDVLEMNFDKYKDVRNYCGAITKLMESVSKCKDYDEILDKTSTISTLDSSRLIKYIETGEVERGYTY